VTALSTALAALGQSLDEHRLAHATTLQSVAPRFTPFAYVRKGEYSVSRIIGDLLNPSASHSQGPLFLDLFMEVFGLQSLQCVSAQAHVSTESATLEGRRIDIIVRDRNQIIGIENKPWAADGELQVADYLKEIRRHGYPFACLVYLTKDGRLPASHSINKRECQEALARGELKLASYEKVLIWLEKCCESCRSERVRNFLFHFRDYLREEVMNERAREPQSPVVEGVLAENARKYLPIALEIAQHQEGIRQALLERLFAGLRGRLPRWEIKGNPMTVDNGLALIPPDATGWFFCVELESDSRKWFYGLKLFEANGASSGAMSGIGKRLRSRFRGSEGPNKHWLMWLWFDDRSAFDPASYSQWENNVQPWLDMADGTMANNFASLATELHEAAMD
jgi:hypothetical protein